MLACLLLWSASMPADQFTVPDLKRAVERLGGLQFIKRVPLVYLDRTSMQHTVRELIEKQYHSRMAEKESLFLTLFGFTDTMLDVKQIRKALLSESAGGYYDEMSGRLAVWDSLKTLNEISAMVVVHELRHALQDQHYDLENFIGRYSDFDDRQLALLAAVEGDATLIMVLFGGWEPEILTSQDPQALVSLSPISNAAAMRGVPDILRDQLLMPYVEGLNFVAAVFTKRKWKGLKQVFVTPPVSSEQILHPEKYLKGELPLEIRIGYQPSGYKLYHRGVVGEYYLGRLLKRGGGAVSGAIGWGGDQFKIYTRDEQYVLLWESEWDDGEAAGRFYHDYRRFLEQRFSLDFRSGVVKGTPFIAARSAEGYFFLRRFQTKIFFTRTNNRDQMNGFIRGGYYD